MKRGFTLVEMLVALAIVASLAAIVSSIVGAAKARGAQATCLNNVDQLTKAVLMYADVNHQGVGRSTEWESWIDILGSPDLRRLQCPEFRVEDWDGPGENLTTRGYAQNDCLVSRLSSPEPSRMVLLTEVASFRPPPGGRIVGSYEPHYLSGPDIYSFAEGMRKGSVTEGYVPNGEFGAVRHGGGCLYSFVDGHAKWLRPTALRLPSHGFGCFYVFGPKWEWKGPESGPYFSPEAIPNTR